MLMSQNTSPSRHRVSAIASEASPSSHDCRECTVSVWPRAGRPGGDTLSRWGSHCILQHGYWQNPTAMLLLIWFLSLSSSSGQVTPALEAQHKYYLLTRPHTTFPGGKNPVSFPGSRSLMTHDFICMRMSHIQCVTQLPFLEDVLWETYSWFYLLCAVHSICMWYTHMCECMHVEPEHYRVSSQGEPSIAFETGSACRWLRAPSIASLGYQGPGALLFFSPGSRILKVHYHTLQ